jgi:prepilin-type N-terminal cleavage/methylation domain-containing protein
MNATKLRLLQLVPRRWAFQSLEGRPLGRSCFNLIELLVVIAIIAILAALLLPSLTKARYQSQITGCMDNIRWMYLARINYADDFKGEFCFHEDGSPDYRYTPGVATFDNGHLGRYSVAGVTEAFPVTAWATSVDQPVGCADGSAVFHSRSQYRPRAYDGATDDTTYYFYRTCGKV